MIGNLYWFQATDKKCIFVAEERDARSKTHSQKFHISIKETMIIKEAELETD